MGMFRLFRRKDSPEQQPSAGHGGYFPLQDAPGRSWDDDDDDIVYRSGAARRAAPAWDESDSRLDRLDRSVAQEERRRQKWWRRAYWQDRRKRWWAVRIVAAIIALFFVLVAWLAITAPLSKSLQPIAPPQITLLASDGTPIARNGAVVEAPVEVAKLPPHVVEAFIATEDRRFYSHWGVDPRGIARAAFTGTGGGSTITQQLAKFTFLTPERSLTRKAREALIAFWLEAWLSKDEILERYLSNAYFGDNMYGLRAASLHYFYRQPENLKPNQAAMLAGLLQAPSAYAPTDHYDRAERRMGIVVRSMVAAGYLTEAEARAMKPPRLDVRNLERDLPTGTYFADWALPEARTLSDVGYSRETLTTTLDSRLQEAARRAIARAPLGRAQVALVAMHPNGEVVAMIGGKDYAQSAFNRATQAQRQPGSTFKLFVYLAALDAGMSPDDTIDGSEITEGSYRPKNAEGRYAPSITLADAFAHSSNVAAVRLQQQVGTSAVIADGAPARRKLQAGRGRSEPGARHFGDEPARADRRLCRGGGQFLPGRTDRLPGRKPGFPGQPVRRQGQLLLAHRIRHQAAAAQGGQRRHRTRRAAVDPQLRQDRHHAGPPRRAVRRLCRRPGGRRVGRQRRRYGDAGRLWRHHSGADLEGFHDPGPGQAGRTEADLAPQPARPGQAA